jgi:uncharacterized protein YjbI with pentapeptide repeats
VLIGGCSLPGALSQPPSLGVFLLLLLGAVLLNLALSVALLYAGERRGRARGVREGLLRELSSLRIQAGADAVARKAALLRELDALGAVPAQLDGFELSGADLRGVRLSGCSLRDANLAGADLQGAVLDQADLFGASLPGANLARGTLRGTNLRGCNLEGASLVKTQLERANLHRAELVGANLHRAALAGARLTLARFARREGGALQLTVHESVDDWIRARLDHEGRYREPDERVTVLRAG